MPPEKKAINIANLSMTLRAIFIRFVLLTTLLAGQVQAQIFEANYNSGNGTGTIGEYDTSGGTINATLVSGLSVPNGMAVSGSELFVTNETTNTIGAYTDRKSTRLNSSHVSE